MSRNLFFATLLLLLSSLAASAQLMVQTQVNRELYLKGETVFLTIGVRNMSGHDVKLEGRPEIQESWLTFEVQTREGKRINPRPENYKMPPEQIPAGETLRRRVNLSKLYNLTGVGDFRVKAQVYFPPMKKYFTAKSNFFTITPGRQIWSRSVGAPEGSGAAGYREYELVTLRDLEKISLYVRIRNLDQDYIANCINLGRLVNSANPQATLDNQNNLHLMFMSKPQHMTYLHFGLNGEILRQERFNTAGTYPRMMQLADGSIRISGGALMPSREELEALRTEAGPPPSVSDRPGI
jgi:hypothetical protein